jgi:hypothetical protein
MSFLGVSYFGQVSTLWFLTLAMIGSTAPIPRRAAVAARKPASRKPTLAAVRRPGKVLDTQRPGRWVNAVR